jgi:hypothetical protein
MRRRLITSLTAVLLGLGGAACNLNTSDVPAEEGETLETPTDDGTPEEPTDEGTETEDEGEGEGEDNSGPG